MRRMIELFIRNTAKKLVNTINKPPLKLLLSYQGLSMFQLYRISNPTMKKISATNPGYHAAIANLWHPFACPCSKNHSPGTIIAIMQISMIHNTSRLPAMEATMVTVAEL